MRRSAVALAVTGVVALALAGLPSAASGAACKPGPKAACAGADLAGARLAGKDLSGAKLARAKLAKARLARANLTGAVLRGADLTGADLRKANLTRAVLAKANLSSADLTRAILGQANLRGADLRGAILTHASLRGADLRRAKIGALGASAAAAAGQRLLAVSRTCLPLKTCTGDVSYADLRGAKLMYVVFLSATLDHADLSGAAVYGAIIEHSTLLGANLAGADLHGAAFAHVDARGANLAGATLDAVTFDTVNLSGVSFAGSDLRGVTFSNADLRGANLNGANLAGVDLRSVQIDSATLAGANIEGALLPETVLTALPELRITAAQAFSATVSREGASVDCSDVTTCSSPVEYGKSTTLSVRTSWAGFAICPDGPVRLVQAPGGSAYGATCTFAPYQGLTITLRQAHWITVVVRDLIGDPITFPRVSIEWREPPTYALVEPATVCEGQTQCVAYYPDGARVKVVTTGDQPYYTTDDGTCTGGTPGAGFLMADAPPFGMTCLVDGTGTPAALTGDRVIALTVS